MPRSPLLLYFILLEAATVHNLLHLRDILSASCLHDIPIVKHIEIGTLLLWPDERQERNVRERAPYKDADDLAVIVPLNRHFTLLDRWKREPFADRALDRGACAGG